MMEQAPIQAQSPSLLNRKRIVQKSNPHDATILQRVHAIGQTRICKPLSANSSSRRPYGELGLSFSLYHTQNSIGSAAESGSWEGLANLLRLANRTNGSGGDISFQILSHEGWLPFLEVVIARKWGEYHL
ncbi:hypothetical protein An02g10880 [Aspergillus niger]|uniref:Uncharacterized protein n=2 Tax=Aspergillus niger TaxID=5061 RepID=A2QEF4_ASPNC|nr:hypothetical protein An02g10880 [Aspergillus niger]CAK48753.1 hypothetical protein An02g10880 [Aspergillus niger]